MKTQSIDLDVLFKRTRLAIEKINGSPMSDGKQTDKKVQDTIVIQQGERSWHELIKKMKSNKDKEKFDYNSILKYYETFTMQKEMFQDVDFFDPMYVEGFFSLSEVDKNRVKKVMETCKRIKDKESKLVVKQNPVITMTIQAMLDFIFEKQNKIIDSLNKKENFYEVLSEDIIDFFSNHHEVIYENDINIINLKTGFAKNKFGIDFDYLYEMEVNDKKIKFTEVEKRVYGAAYVELIKDSLLDYATIIEKTEFTKIDFKVLKARLIKKTTKIFKEI